jgi:hypothetical protein
MRGHLRDERDTTQGRGARRAGSGRSVPRRLGAGAVALVLAAAVACAGGDDDESGTGDERSPATTAADAGDAGDAGGTTVPATGSTCPAATDTGATAEPEPVGGPSVPVEPIGEADGVTVSAAAYPLPDTVGDPWSQWGQGVVVPDGRFVSAVGDHQGVDGTSWFYEYDPATGQLVRTAEVSEALGHQPGDWGYGKVHAPMVLGPCDEVITATYWGTRTDLVVGGSYAGDHLVRYDPATHQVGSLGVPVPGFGIPSIAISPDRRWLFGEAVDPASDTEADTGAFFVADAATGEVVHRDDDPDHVGFRAILVTGAGEALYAAPGGDVFGYTPGDDAARRLPGVLPGDWLRTASPIAPDGTVYGATREPDQLFRVAPDGSVADMGPAEDYVASLGLSPDGGTLFYVPDAHGSAWTTGAPLVAVDTATGEHRVVVELNGMLEDALGLRAGGSYNVVADPDGRRVYVGMNTGPAAPSGDDEDDTFGTPVLLVVDLP